MSEDVKPLLDVFRQEVHKTHEANPKWLEAVLRHLDQPNSSQSQEWLRGNIEDGDWRVLFTIAIGALRQAQQREQAAYERGKAEGREAERGRCLAILNAQMQTATISEERAVEGGWFQNAQMHEAKANALKEAMDAIQPIDINQE